jgi:hypothetical protein
MSKSAGATQTTSSSAPASFQQPYIDQMLSEAKRLYGTGGPQFFPGSTVAGFTPQEEAGHTAIAGAAGQMADTFTNSVAPAIQTGLGAIDVANNPYVKAAAEAAIRPVTENLQQNILPSIRNAAVGTGNQGSTRQGIAEGLAIKGANQTAADTTASMYSNAYNSGLSSLGNTLSMIPSLQEASLQPGQTITGLGEQQRALEQANLNEQIARWQYEQALPYQNLTEFANLARGQYGGTGTSEVTSTGGDSATSILGLALQIPGLWSLISDYF